MAAVAAHAQDLGLELIVVPTDAEAAEIRTEFEAGAAFHVLATEYSVDPSGSVGGDLGVVAIDDLRPEFREVLRGIEPGEIRGPVAIDDRYALLRRHTTAERSWLDAMESGRVAVDELRYLAAIDAFERATAIARDLPPRDPRLGTSLAERAEMSRRIGDLQAAATLYMESLEVLENTLGPGHPGTVSSLSALAEVHLALAEHSAAAAAFERLRSLWEDRLGPDHPDVASILNSLGLIHYLEGEYSEATSLFTRVLAIWEQTLGPEHPNVASVLFNLGTVAVAESRFDDAERSIRRSQAIVEQELGPDHPDVSRHLDALAELRGMQEDWSGAISFYEQSLGIQWGLGPSSGPEVVEVLDRFVDVLTRPFLESANADAAWNRFRESLAEAPLSEDFFLAASTMLRDEGQVPESELVLGLGEERFAGSSRIQTSLGELAVDQGRTGEAVDRFRAALNGRSDPPGSAAIQGRLGDVFAETGRPDQARIAYERAIEIEPNEVSARIGLGTLLGQSDDLTEALEYLEEAVRLSPDNALALYRLSEVLLQLGRPDEAEMAATRALESDPDDRRLRYVRGQARIVAGQEGAGREDLDRYAALESLARRENEELLQLSLIERDAQALLLGGNSTGALETLRAGIERYPDAYRLTLSLALTFGQLDMHEDAVGTLESMIERGLGDDAVIRKALAKIEQVGLDDDERAAQHRALYMERIGAELRAAYPQ